MNWNTLHPWRPSEAAHFNETETPLGQAPPQLPIPDEWTAPPEATKDVGDGLDPSEAEWELVEDEELLRGPADEMK
jgi:hypothetical protein